MDKVQLPSEYRQALERMAAESGVSVAELVRAMIMATVESVADTRGYSIRARENENENS